MKNLIKIFIFVATVLGITNSPLANAESSFTFGDSYDLSIALYLEANDDLGNSF